MSLDSWATAEGKDDVQLSILFGCSRSYVHKMRRRGAIPGRELMARIRQATNGQVTPNDFYADAAAGVDLSPEEAPANA